MEQGINSLRVALLTLKSDKMSKLSFGLSFILLAAVLVQDTLGVEGNDTGNIFGFKNNISPRVLKKCSVIILNYHVIKWKKKFFHRSLSKWRNECHPAQQRV